ncbi:kinase-like domain-containing protein [Fusarium sp. MPI-SDFR-AT-0072]|nr:kinase-like domain-containing protein [Fusarium sp. MPI-SDFR-AT-0072]
MESREINSGLLMRLLTLFLYKLNKTPCLRRLRKHPGLPKVYCSLKYKGRVYILMERIQESKARILAQLKAMTAELRSIPPPDGAGVANFDGGPIFDQHLPDKSFWGPFATIQEFHQELRRGLKLADGEEACPGLRELIEFHNGPWEGPVFTQGDLSSLNIMAAGDTVTGIVDWESAGWMPPYWEYTSAWHVNPRNTFWRDAVDGFLTPLPHELEMERIRRQYFGEF